MAFDVIKVRQDFPILQQKVYGKPLVYLDNAATSQKPQQVIDSMINVYTELNSNIHRGVHYLSNQSTVAFEEARKKIQTFINASGEHEVIFTRGTTEAINLVAHSFGDTFLNEGDEVIVSELEHHSNIVPWQLLRDRKNITIKVIPIDEAGELMMDKFEELLSSRTKLVSVAHVSNALGTINPVEEVIRIAHDRDIPVLIDGAQAVQHVAVDVQKLDCDFYAFSGHKLYGPTGIGVLYGKAKWLEEMQPYHGGGEMIKKVTFDKTTYNELPFKFEAGTPDYCGAIGLGVAIDYVKSLDLAAIADYEHELLTYATNALQQVDGLRIYGTSEQKSGVISFLVDNIHPYDMGMMLDKMGIAVRTGHHCAQPIMDHYNIPGTVRASFGLYNQREEIDQLVAGVLKVKQLFG
ncbi:cysteine desulfurase [Marinilabiliaceae bacterium JC017]|nr:cysteine desulfurase [Marinilabiliaceae bacterium JC017]